MTDADLNHRILVVIYDLADGQVGQPVSLKRIHERCNELGIKTMTQAQFEAYREWVVLSKRN